MAKQLTDQPGRSTNVLTFLIADVRGYTRFTRERGDAAAAILAKRFADLARDAVEARGGRVIELRGDEALAVFESPVQAVRAAVEFQATCAEESEADPAFPLPVGIGIDSGEAVPVEDGYRGVALNMAARLCSKAAAGQVLVTRAIVDSAKAMGDEITFLERGPASFKGFEQAVDVIEAIAGESPQPPSEPEPPAPEGDRGIPPELDPLTPLVDREHEMRWLRGTWRQIRRGQGRVLFVSGPAQIGKTRLAGEIAAHAHADGGVILYAGTGGAAMAMALSAIRATRATTTPTLLVLDDVDVAGPPVAQELLTSLDEFSRRPVLVLALLRDRGAAVGLAAVIDRADGRGDSHRVLPPLDLDGVRGIVRLYAGEDTAEVPVESMARASGGVPGRVHEVVSDWARSEATRRLAAAAEFLAAGRDRHASDLEFANNVIGLKLGRLYSVEGRDVLSVEMCPYKGLAAFEQDDSAQFFGRERLVGVLAARTVQVGLLGLVGPSGSGKSSVIAAGLLPSLKAGLLPGSEQWRQASMRPGDHPMDELRSALSTEAEDPFAAAVAALPSEGRLVLVVDQFEETFTACTTEEERAAFIDALTGAAERWPERVVVIAAIRADYYGHCAPYPELAEALAANHVLVGPLTREELRRAIELPARRSGLRVESALTGALVEEVADEPGGLPLLSTALVELWQGREGGWIRVDAYERTGGVRGAVSRLAESSYTQLSEAEQEAARLVFLRLVATGEGEVLTRRRVLLEEFDLDRDSAPAGVLARLTQDRLLTMSDSTVEVAHEALLREWPRLRGWLEEDAQGRQLRHHLTQASRQWQSGGQETSELYRGVRLSATLDWSAGHASELNELERHFLAASREAGEREAERQRRANRRLRGLLAGVAVFLVVALVAGALALIQRGHARQAADRAQRQAQIATARELAAAADSNLSVDPERSVLLALQAVATTRQDGVVLPEAEQALHNAVEANRLVFTIRNPSTANVEYSPGGRLIATGGTAAGSGLDDVFLWDARTGALVRRLSGHTGDISSVAFNADGSRLVTTADDDRTIVWDTDTGASLLTVPGAPGQAFGASFSPDGTRIAIGARNEGPIRILDAATGTEVRTIREQGLGFSGPEFSPDGSRIAAGGWTGTSDVRVWEVASGKRVLTIPDGGGSAVYNPDGSRILTASGEVWDARTGRRLFGLQGHTGSILGTAWSADGTMIATGGSDGTARVWDAGDGHQLLVLAGHAGLVAMVDFSPDGTRLLTGGGDGTARVWDITAAGGAEAFTAGEPDYLNDVAYSADGSKLLTTGYGRDGGFLWDASTGRKLRSYPGLFRFGAFALGAGTIVGLGCYSICPSFTVIDAAAGTERHAFAPRGWNFGNSAFSPDGQLLATAQEDGSVALWEVSSGKRLRDMGMPSAPGVSTESVAFSPNGKVLAAIDTHATVTVWNVSTAGQLLNFHAHRGLAHAVAFSSDGRLLATSAGDGAAVWNASAGKRIDAFTGSGSVNDVAFSHDGRLLATAGDNGTVGIWDVASGRQTLTLGKKGEGLAAVAFSPDGTRLATTGGDGGLRVYLLRLGDLIRVAQARLTRGFTEAECRQYLHVTACPASIRSSGAPGATSGISSRPPPHEGPEGAFRVTIARSDFSPGLFSRDDISGKLGDYTLSLVGGDWRLFQALPSGDTWYTSGTYRVAEDRITFTDAFDSGCFGWSYSARWSVRGMTLLFADTSSTVVPNCLSPPKNDAWVATLLGSHPWARVAHHEKGG